MKARPNDPCPCGSGLKFKKCHGVTPIRAEASTSSRPVASAERACGSCTACCDGWAKGVVNGIPMHPGRPCAFRATGAQGGCGIYETRPQQPCRDFVCGWLEAGSPFPDDWRPDTLGMLIFPVGWRGKRAYVLRYAGREPDEATLGWLRAFQQRTGRPVLVEQAGKLSVIGDAAFLAAYSKHEARLA